jgi:TolB protein
MSAALLAVALALLALGAATAAAAPGEIAYRCGLDICLLDPDHPSNPFNLTDNEGVSFDESPAWSPDGRRLAFVSNFGTGTRNVFVMEPTAPDQSFNLAVQVTHYTDGGYLNDPVWSPDGTKIAFTRGVDEGSRSIAVANANGTTVTPVTVTEHGQHPSWAPDGGKIAYSYGKQVFLKNSDGSGAAVPLANGEGKEPAWSPDGSRIAFDFGEFSSFHVVGANGLGAPTAIPMTSQYSFATWSPDGSRIAYREVEGEEGFFAIVNADGTGAHPLNKVPEVNGYLNPPSWSPDGSRIVYEGYHYKEAGKPFKLELANISTGAVTSIAVGDEPVWRPTLAASPQVFTPAGGTTGALPGPTQAPKRVWITKRVFVTSAPYVPMLSVGCSAPRCNVGGSGSSSTSRGSSAAGIHPRTGGLAALSAAKPKGSKKPKKAKPVAVGNVVKTTILQGQTKTVKFKLNATGLKLVKQLGKLTIDVTLTIASPGQATLTEHHRFTVTYKPPKHSKKGR